MEQEPCCDIMVMNAVKMTYGQHSMTYEFASKSWKFT